MKFLTYFFTRILRYHINVLMFFRHISSFFYTWPNIIFSSFLYLSFFYENLIILDCVTKNSLCRHGNCAKIPITGMLLCYKGIPERLTSFVFYGIPSLADSEKPKIPISFPSHGAWRFRCQPGHFLCSALLFRQERSSRARLMQYRSLPDSGYCL